MAPARRGWRPAIPAAVVGASLSLGAGLAFGAGGAIAPPDPPKVTDVVCISKCGGIRKATTTSKIQLTGRHLRQISKVAFSAGQAAGSRPTRSAAAAAWSPPGSPAAP